MSAAESALNQNYQLVPCSPFGATVYGLALKENTPPDTIQRLISDVHAYKLLVVKNQGVISGDRQVAITQWFGEVETAGFELHERSPHRAVLRVSNEDTEGFRDFGTSGFHVDGSFMEMPNAYSIYHIVAMPTRGETLFVPLGAVYSGLCASDQRRWDRLWFVKSYNRIRGYQDHPGHVTHPLVYEHPVTGLKTLCIALGKTSFFIWDKNSEQRRKTTKEETKELAAEITREIYRNDGGLIYRHQWAAGDLILSDNLAVGHMASPETQLPREEVGLRVMHRTIVKGMVRPRKN